MTIIFSAVLESIEKAGQSSGAQKNLSPIATAAPSKDKNQLLPTSSANNRRTSGVIDQQADNSDDGQIQSSPSHSDKHNKSPDNSNQESSESQDDWLHRPQNPVIRRNQGTSHIDQQRRNSNHEQLEQPSTVSIRHNQGTSNHDLSNDNTVEPGLSDIRSTHIPGYPTHQTEPSPPRYLKEIK